MEFRFFSYEDGKKTVVRDDNDIAQLAAHGFEGFAELVDDKNESVCGLQNVFVPQGDMEEVRDILLNLIADLHIGGRDGDAASMVYTTGNCDILAMALAESFPEGRIVGVFDLCDENSKVIHGPSYLIHSGVLIGDKVVDVCGVSDREDWFKNWSQFGSCDVFFAEINKDELDRWRPDGPSVDDMKAARDVAGLFRVVVGTINSFEPMPSI